MTAEELRETLLSRREGELLDLQKAVLKNLDLSHWDLHGVDLTWADLEGSNFDGANLDGSVLDHTLMAHCSLRGAMLRRASLKAANLRWSDLTGLHIEGTNVWCSVFEYAKMDDITDDADTKHFRLHCPETGAFLGYKKCFNDRLVQLLIPADARRSSATNSACRCDKAKVLTIKSFDYEESFREAWSLVNGEFYYRVGQWVEVPDFNPDRWMESTTGIHFWLTREEALAY